MFDPNNHVNRLCAEGIAAEGEGAMHNASEKYEQAWSMASSDDEKFTAAHYLARVQTNPEATLEWNLTALRHALASNNDVAAVSYPSLYLNVAKSYEDIGNLVQAKAFYEKASTASDSLPESEYGALMRRGIQAGIARMAGQV